MRDRSAYLPCPDCSPDNPLCQRPNGCRGAGRPLDIGNDVAANCACTHSRRHGEAGGYSLDAIPAKFVETPKYPKPVPRARTRGADPVPQERPAPGPAHELVSLADVQPERVRWLWPQRIPLGKVTILDGDPGLGKSALTLDLAARVSRGWAMPDGSTSDLAEPANVVLLSAEDGLADTIRPRLDAAGADVTRVHALTYVVDAAGPRLPTLTDLTALREVVAQTAARLVVVDPFMAYVDGTTNTYRDQDVRRVLAPVAQLAAELDAAVVLIRHLTKGEATGSPLYRGGGSIGIIGAARAGLLVAPDPDDLRGLRRILVPTKSNLSAPAPALAYALEIAPSGTVRIAWEGPTAHTAAGLLAGALPAQDRSELDEAKRLLREILAEGAYAAKEVRKEAKEAGVSDRTLDRAKVALGVVAQRVGERCARGGGYWAWQLPEPIKDASDSALPALYIVTDGALNPSDGHLPNTGAEILSAPGVDSNGALNGVEGIKSATPQGVGALIVSGAATPENGHSGIKSANGLGIQGDARLASRDGALNSAIIAADPALPEGCTHWCAGAHPAPVPLPPKVDRCSGCARIWRPPPAADCAGQG
jgi:hypothetical protein